MPMISDVLVRVGHAWADEPHEIIFWRITLDIILPLLGLWVMAKLVEWGAARARKALALRMQGDATLASELQKQSTIWGLVLLSLRDPVAFMLPPLLVAYTVRTALHIVDFVVNEFKPTLPALLDAGLKAVSAQLVPLDNGFTKILSISSIMFVSWFFIRLKDILIDEVVTVRATRSGRKELERVVLPLSSLLSWATVLAAGISVCGALGINLKPVLAVGGAGGIAAGFASQQVLQNVVSGINIFLSRPFVVGEQVVFAGFPSVEGIVEGVEIMRTLVRTNEGVVVAVPNKLVAEMVIFNRTRSLSYTTPSKAASAAASKARVQRVLTFGIKLKRDAEPQLKEVRAAVLAHMASVIRSEGLIANGSSDDDASPSPSPPPTPHPGKVSTGNGAASAAVVTELPVVDFSSDRLVKGGVSSEMAVAVLPRVMEAAVEAALEAKVEAVFEDEPVPVVVSLARLTDDTVELFVKAELSVRPSLAADGIERKMEEALMSVSQMVRSRFDGLVITQSTA